MCCTGYATVLVFSVITSCTAGVINSTDGNPIGTSDDYSIVGGHSVNIEDYPYQVSVNISGKYFCGGCIISEKYILSAAHCFIGINETNVTIRAGSSFRNKGGLVSGVSKIFIHPTFRPTAYDYDVAVLRLSKPLVLGKLIGKISLPSPGTIIPHEVVSQVTGWGTLYEGGPVPDQLQEVDLPIINKTMCNKYYRSGLTDRMFCAGYDQGGKDACQADSGGPLAVSGIVIGITSWGGTCAAPEQPGVYTNVLQCRAFIDLIIKT